MRRIQHRGLPPASLQGPCSPLPPTPPLRLLSPSSACPLGEGGEGAQARQGVQDAAAQVPSPGGEAWEAAHGLGQA